MATSAHPRPAQAPWSPSTARVLFTALVAAGFVALLHELEAPLLGWVLAAIALVPVHALATTLGRYRHSQAASLADCRSQGDVPWRAIAHELALLWGLQVMAAGAAMGQLAACVALLTPLSGADWRFALPLAAVGLAATPGCEFARAYLRHKLERFYRFDGVVTVTPTPPEEASRAARFDRWLEARLYPPALAAPPAVIEFLQAAHPLPEGLCPVCGDALGAAPRVACTRCRGPHHRDCFEFSEGCARYGCGSSDAEALSAASISAAEG